MVDSKFFNIPFATSGDKTVIPEAVQPSGAISYAQGYGPDYERDPASDPLAKRVPRDETNELYYEITNALKFIQLYGTPEYTPVANGGPANYPLTARVRYDAGAGMQVWCSIVATNTAVPGSDQTKWVVDDAFTEASLAEAIAGTIGGKAITPRRLASSVQRSVWDYGTAGGTANALTLTLVPALLAYVAGLRIRVVIATTNTGAVTININGLGARSAVNRLGGALVAGDLQAGAIVEFYLDGAGNFRVNSVIASDVASGYIAAGRPPQTAPQFTARGVGGGATYANNVTSISSDMTLVSSHFLDPATTFVGGKLTIGPLDAGVWRFSANLGLNTPQVNWSSKVSLLKNAVGANPLAYAEIYNSGTPVTGNLSVSGGTVLVDGDYVAAYMQQNLGTAQTSSSLGTFSGERVGV